MGSTATELGPLRVGIVGTGVGLRTHAPGWLANGAEIIGVVGSSTERGRELIGEAGLDPGLSCTAQELQNRSFDVLCLTTPPADRDEWATWLRDWSGTALIEKPIGLDEESAKTQWGSRPKTYIDFQMRSLPTIRGIADAVRNGSFGSVYRIDIVEQNSAYRSELPFWQHDRNSGGGQRLAMGTHLVDLARYLSSSVMPAVGVAGLGATRATSRGDADEVFGCSWQLGEISCSIHTSGLGFGDRLLRIEVVGTRAAVSVVFSGNNASMHLAGNVALDIPKPPAEFPQSIFREAFVAYAAEINRVVRATSTSDVLATLSDGYICQGIVDQVSGIELLEEG